MFFQRVHQMLDNRLFWVLLFIGNIAAAFVWSLDYTELLSVNPLYFWPIIPKCPVYLTLFMVFMLLNRKGRNYPVLNFFAFVGLIKYAFWKFISFALYFNQIDPSILLVDTFGTVFHLIMILDAVILVPFLRKVSLGYVILNFLWFTSVDFADYFFGIHTEVPSGDFLHFMMIENFAINVVLVLLFMLLVKKFHSEDIKTTPS